MIETQYRDRIDALEAVWSRWADTGATLSEQQWIVPTRCPGWNIAALYAHVGMFPRALLAPPPVPHHDPVSHQDTADPVTAVDILRGFNAPGGVAHEMAEQVEQAAVATAAELKPSELVAHFAEAGPSAVAALRGHQATSVVAWPAAAAVITWAEAVRIVLLESVVHLLDVFDGLSQPSDVPNAGLRETARLLAEIAEPVWFIETATGRRADSPLPVLR